MRKIENGMNQAAFAGVAFSSGNTSVKPIDSVNVAVFLHGNEIATINSETGFVMVNKDTLMNWPTVTTMSRLRALGVNVYKKAGAVYLDDERLTK